MKKAFMLIGLLGTSLMAAEKTIYDFTLNSIDGQSVPLSSYKGKVALLVNVASRCGYTPQYSALESVFEKYKDRGFRDHWISGEQFWCAGTGDESRDQNVLHSEISRDLSQ